MRKATLFAATAMLTLSTAHAAAAQSLYAFGDSLSDNGNLFKLIGYPPPPYYQGHFSNGPIWVEYLPGLTGLNFTPGQDYAYGGAFTGNITVDGVDYGNNLLGAAPGINTEIASFTAAGGHFNASDVVTLWGGANNYFQYAEIVEADPANAVSLVTNGVASTITQLTADTHALINLGARTLIVPNLPNLGSTPNFNTSALATELGNAFSTAHDEALPVQMAMLHGQTGANIIVVNTQQLLANAIAHPSAYGFTNVTDECLTTPACVNGSAATQNTYLFWDDVHPTTHAQLLVAEYAAASLNGFEALSVPARLGTSDQQNFDALLSSRMDTLHAAGTGFTYNVDAGNFAGPTNTSTDPAQKFSLYITGSGSFGARNNQGANLGYTDNGTAVAFGGDYQFTPTLRAGVAVGITQDHANVNEGGSVDDNGTNVGVYALATRGPFYTEISGAFGSNTYKIKHNAVLGGNIYAKPKGDSYSANLTAGYVFGITPNLSLTPSAGLGYTNAGLNGYTESGDPLLTQQVENQGYQQVLGQAGLEAATILHIGGAALSSYASAGMQARLTGANSQFSSVFTDEPLVPLTTTYPMEPVAWALLGAGINAIITPQLVGSAGLQATAFKANGNDLTVSGALSYRF